MNAEINKIGTEQTELAAATEKEKTASKPKKKKSPPRPLPEKLKNLYAQRDKAINDQTEAENKAKKIESQIANLKKEIHEKELRSFDNFCTEKNISFSEIHSFISAVTEKMTLSEAAAILNVNMGSDNNAE